MRTYKTSALIIISLAISACNVNTKSVDREVDSLFSKHEVNDTTLFATMQMKDSIKVGEPVVLKFIVYNYTDSTNRFCSWHTPYEPLMSKYLEVKDADGIEADYLGPMAKRMMPPPDSSYQYINSGDSIPATVDLLKAYRINKPSKYTIVYTGKNMSGLNVKDSVSFVYYK
nr:protease [Pedobacter panaciterrae]